MLVLAITLDQPTLLGLAAFLTASTGVATTIMAIRKSRAEDHEELLKRLEQSREHEEKLAAELHRLKMEHPELVEPEENAPDES
jgi:hypothetical protein